MGPADEMPAFQAPPFAPDADTKVSITKIKIPCNWSHPRGPDRLCPFVHTTFLRYGARAGKVPVPATRTGRGHQPTSRQGFLRSAPLTAFAMWSAADQECAHNDYLRITVYVAPFISLIPPNDSYNVCSINVPVDDNNTWFYFVAWGDENCIDADDWRAFNHAVVGKDLNADYSTKRTLENDFMQDRDAMAAGNLPACRAFQIRTS